MSMRLLHSQCLKLLLCFLSASILPVGCSDTEHAVTAAPESLVLVNGTLFDGTGTDAVADAAVLISGGRISALGPRSRVAVPAETQVIDVRGGFILPGFINAHVHNGFSGPNMHAWAFSGVTTVRDMELLSSNPSLAELYRQLVLRHTTLSAPEYARLVCIGYIITVPGGYGRTTVSTPTKLAGGSRTS